MTGRDRVSCVLQRGIPDRVPTFEWDIDSRVIHAMTGGGTYEDLVESLDLDAVMGGPEYLKSKVGERGYVDEWGVTRIKSLEDYAMPVDAMAPITRASDLSTWRPPDPYEPGRFRTMRERIRRFKGERAIVVRLRDVWSNPRDLLGYERFLMACVDSPDFVAAVIEKCIDHSIQLAEVAADLGAEIVMTGDDIADNTGMMVSPSTWESLFLPQFRRFVDAVHQNGLYYWKHTDGNIMSAMESLVEAGIDGIDPVDPLAGMDLPTIKTRWGRRIAIKGNVGCTHVLVDGTPETVVAAVKQCIRSAAPAGGYACSSSNSIHSGVRPELYRMMVEAIHEYGTYPLDIDRLGPSLPTPRRK